MLLKRKVYQGLYNKFRTHAYEIVILTDVTFSYLAVGYQTKWPKIFNKLIIEIHIWHQQKAKQQSLSAVNIG
jgi:hypothetical protein